jgi:hypothetical protein
VDVDDIVDDDDDDDVCSEKSGYKDEGWYGLMPYLSTYISLFFHPRGVRDPAREGESELDSDWDCELDGLSE